MINIHNLKLQMPKHNFDIEKVMVFVNQLKMRIQSEFDVVIGFIIWI